VEELDGLKEGESVVELRGVICKSLDGVVAGTWWALRVMARYGPGKRWICQGVYQIEQIKIRDFP